MKKLLSSCLRWCLCIFSAISLYGFDASAADWAITDLGSLGGDSSNAYGINRRGQIVGESYTDTFVIRGFLYDGTMSALGTLGGSYSGAYDINASGQIVGWSWTSGPGQPLHAFLLTNGTMLDLGTAGGPYSLAMSINARGNVGGGAYDTHGFYRAFLYDGSMHDLGTLGGPHGFAYGINDSGVVVGESTLSDGYWHAFSYDGSMRDLGTLPGTQLSTAYSINASGIIVGASYSSGFSDEHAFLYNGIMQDLGALPGDASSVAYGVNAGGSVVGVSYAPGGGNARAFLYNGAILDLGALPEVVSAGWQRLYDVQAINDSGQIVGSGVNGAGSAHAFRLHPQTTSRYMTTVDSTALYNLGCAQTNQNGLLILDFGQPWFSAGEYGTIYPDSSAFVSIPAIESAVIDFLTGYYICEGHPGKGFMTVAVGTNNFGSQVSIQHGREWGLMIARLNDFLRGSFDWTDRLAVVGASDIEMGYSGPLVARAWVDGYAATSMGNRYYNYGDANGCPTSGLGPCNNGWTQEDVWYVSWGNAANPLPVPEIYYNAPPGPPTHARRWATLATLHGTSIPMPIPGVLSQRQACNDPTRTCASGYNTPVQSWYQLMDALYGVATNPNAVQNVLYSSDITWQN